MNNKLIVLVGPPGSGKSTFVLQHISKQFQYINQDLQGADHLQIFDNALLQNQDIVVDRMNFNKIQRSRYLELAKDHGYSTKIVVLHESYSVCFERMKNRKDHLTIKDEKSAKAALKTFFTKYERVTDDEADEVIRIWPDRPKQRAVWVDMDNTLSNATHREHFVQGPKKDWKSFFDEMSKDPVNLWCHALVNGISTEADIVICSARPDNYRQQTLDWLDKNGIIYHDLVMRHGGDFRKDSIVKEIMYEFEIKTKYNLLFCVDDRKQVIDQIRSHGVVVLDCVGEKGHF